jgi:hypothetical protein
LKRIPLTKGKFTIVDDEDYKWLSQWKWCARKDNKTSELFYAARTDWSSGKPIAVFMHSEIFGPACDHKNRNSLDNRRQNLRTASKTQQNCNQRLRKDNTSGFKGVGQSISHPGVWVAKIQINRKTLHLGYYKTKEEAARAYDHAASKYHGEFAYLNFPNNV